MIFHDSLDAANALRQEISEILAAAQRGVHDVDPDLDWSDPGDVPVGYMDALVNLADRLGYNVNLKADMSAHEAILDRLYGRAPGTTFSMGVTFGPLAGSVIDLRADMQPAAATRVLSHELSHIILGHMPRDEHEAQLEYERRVHESQVVNDQEAACELAAGAVCRLAQIGSPDIIAYNLMDRGLAFPGEEVRWAALLAARVIWERVGQLTGSSLQDIS